MPVQTPSLAEVFSNFRESLMADLRVALPARVERYDSATQLVDVQPLLKESVAQEDGTTAAVRLPMITNVPVVFPGAGGMRITFPVAVGDTVLLVFADRSLDVWQTHGGETAPDDARRHHLTDAVAIPGLHANSAPHAGADTALLTIGSDAGAEDMVATANRVLTELNKVVSAFNSHTHVESGGTTAPPVPQVAGVVAPASATVKVRG